MIKKITGKYVVGFKDDDHVIIENGEVVYKDDQIVYVGQNYEGEVDESVNVGNAIISPGFIDLNALGDIDHDIIHFEKDSKSEKNLWWSEEYFDEGPREAMSPEEESFKSLYAYTQLILHGVTTAMPITSVLYKRWAETFEEIEAAVHHAGKLGLRLYIGPSYQSGMRVVQPDGNVIVKWKEDEGQQGLDRAIRFIKEYDNAYDGLIKGIFAPERVETQTPEILKKTKQASDELGALIKLHAAQGEFEYNYIYDNYGKTTIQYLNDLGFLDKNVAIPHAHWVSSYSKAQVGEGDDIKLISESGATVVHCPLIIGRHGSAIESFHTYRSKGVNMALGTDTFPPDIFQNIRISCILSNVIEERNENTTFRELFRAATVGGAKFLGRKDLGRLEAGAKADIIVIGLEGYHIGAIDDPIRTALFNATGRDVKMTIINGRTVMQDRKIPGIDLEELKLKGQRYFNKRKRSYMERDYQQLSESEIFKPTFKMIKKK